MTTILVIGDPHAQAGISNERFDWLGNVVLDRRPEVIVCMGDFADLESLSSYDKGRRSFEGRRYNLDIEVCRDALARINAPVDEYNEQCRRNKKALYRPRKVMLLGNHDEGRINRVTQMHPELDGLMNIDQLGYQVHGWEVIPYTIPICIEDIYFCHTFPSGVKGEPIGGVNVAQSLLAKNMVSSICGHNHQLDVAIRATPAGRKMWAISAGCYFEHPMEYAKATEHLYWRGLIFLNNVSNGDLDLETINIEEVKRRYHAGTNS